MSTLQRSVWGRFCYFFSFGCMLMHFLEQKEFEEQGKRCFVGEEAPPSTSYHRDELKCDSNFAKVSLFLFFFLLTIIVVSEC